MSGSLLTAEELAANAAAQSLQCIVAAQAERLAQQDARIAELEGALRSITATGMSGKAFGGWAGCAQRMRQIAYAALAAGGGS